MEWKINPIATIPHNRFVILFGRSGYHGTLWRCEVGRHAPHEYPRAPWRNHANDSFEDGGEPPIGWLPLPAGKPAEYTKAQRLAAALGVTEDALKDAIKTAGVEVT